MTKEQVFILTVYGFDVMMNHFMDKHLAKRFLCPINTISDPYLTLTILIGIETKRMNFDVVAIT